MRQQWWVARIISVPLGDTWYDALRTNVTKRLSQGLDFVLTYTYSKNLALGAEENNNYASVMNPIINDVFNRQANKTLSAVFGRR